MQYNNYIENKEQLLSDLGPFFDLVEGKNRIKLIDINVFQPEFNHIECMIRNISYQYKIELITEVIEGPESGYKSSMFINIPKMSSKGFVIANRDGITTWRAGINIGKIDKIIQLWGESLETNFGIFKISDKVDDNKIIYANYSFTDNGTHYNFKLYPYLKYLGISEDILKKYFLECDEEPSKYFIRKLEGLSAKRFKDKYFQLTKKELIVDGELNGSDIMNLIELAISDPDKFSYFSPFDVTFINQYSSLIEELNYGKWKIQRELTKSFKNKKLFDGNIINKVINKIFSLQSESLNSIQTGSDSNAGAFLSQSNKIYFYKGRNKVSIEKYTPDFVGIICPLKTPESVSLVNVKNELARNIKIDNNNILIEVYDKTFNKIKLDYSTYYRSKILSLDNFDYDNNKVVPLNNKISYLYAGDYYTEEYTSEDQFDYIRCTDSDLLSYSAAMVPKMNMNDSIRISMSTNMMDQAIPVLGSRSPIVATGVEREVYKNSDMTLKSNIDGKVTGIIDNFIKITDIDGVDHIIATPPNRPTLNHTYNIYKPMVKVGDDVKSGQVILASNSFKDEQLSLTVPLVAAYTDYKFGTMEDGFVIREGVRHLLAHEMEKELEVNVLTELRCKFDRDLVIESLKKSNTSEQVLKKIYSLNNFGLPKVGDKFVKGDAVLVYMQEQDPNSNRNAWLKKKTGLEPDFLPIIKTLPYGMDKGEVIDVQVVCHPTVTEDNIPKFREYYIDEFEKSNRKIADFLNNDSIVRRREITYHKDYRVMIYIKFRYVAPANVGSKISNRFGSKGSIVKIIPDELAARIGGKDGLMVDVFISPKAKFNRKNPATDDESILGLIAKCAYEKGEKLLKEKSFGEYSSMLNLVHVTDKWSDKSDEELLNYHNSQKNYYQLIVTAYDKKYSHKKISELCRYFNIDLSGDYLYFPEYGELTRNKVMVGITNIMRLHFMEYDKLKATSEINTGDELVLGAGTYRPGGQKIGEMESWNLRAYGMMEIVEDLSGKSFTKLTRPRLESSYLNLGLMINIEDEWD